MEGYHGLGQFAPLQNERDQINRQSPLQSASSNDSPFLSFSFYHPYPSIIRIFKKQKKVYIDQENSQWRSREVSSAGSPWYAEAMNFNDALHIFIKGVLF